MASIVELLNFMSAMSLIALFVLIIRVLQCIKVRLTGHIMKTDTSVKIQEGIGEFYQSRALYFCTLLPLWEGRYNMISTVCYSCILSLFQGYVAQLVRARHS